MSLYEIDYGLWLEDQIAQLKLKNWQNIEPDLLIEELEALNKSNQRELYSYVVVVLAHMLKWQFQPELQCGSWRASIQNGRRRIERLFKDQPSLKPYIAEILPEAYQEAKEWAEEETELDLFPTNCPYSLVEMLNREFFPDNLI
jgi:hypothetical protein